MLVALSGISVLPTAQRKRETETETETETQRQRHRDRDRDRDRDRGERERERERERALLPTAQQPGPDDGMTQAPAAGRGVFSLIGGACAAWLPLVCGLGAEGVRPGLCCASGRRCAAEPPRPACGGCLPTPWRGALQVSSAPAFVAEQPPAAAPGACL